MLLQEPLGHPQAAGPPGPPQAWLSDHSWSSLWKEMPTNPIVPVSPWQLLLWSGPGVGQMTGGARSSHRRVRWSCSLA